MDFCVKKINNRIEMQMRGKFVSKGRHFSDLSQPTSRIHQNQKKEK